MTDSQPEEDYLSSSLSFPARFESLDGVREFVGGAAETCGFQASEVYALQLAVDEAVTNIIEHAFGGECAEIIQCTCRFDGDHLTILLRDSGQPFDPTQVPEPDVTADLEDRQVGGLGLFFMHRLMDQVSFEFTPGSEAHRPCNTLTMTKRKEKGP